MNYCYHKLGLVNLARLTDISYSRPEKVLQLYKDKQLPIQPIKQPIFIENKETDTQAYVLHLENKESLIAFPGTFSIRDAFTDMKTIFRVKTEFGTLHRGFYQAWKSVIHKISTEIIDSDRIYITSHSLGSALATLTALHLSQQGKVVDNITFGCPRVGDKKFKEQFKNHVAKNMRIVCRTDPIPHLPTRVRFRHVDNPIIIDNKPLPWWKRILCDVFDIVFSPIDDHLIDNYIRELKNIESHSIETNTVE